LLGQNVNAYRGKMDSTDEANIATDATSVMTFAQLLRRVHDDNPSLARLRFMTSHPKDFSDDLITAVRDLPRVCKSVHLPLQSGSTRVLADMNRYYTQAQYLELCAKLQAAIPDIGITTDIIVAYPGETDEDFEETLRVVETVRYASAFTFIYSKRSGTPAADRTDTVLRKIANERFERLTATLYPIMAARNETRIGQTVDVMVEEATPTGGKGRTDDNMLVHFTHSARDAFNPGDIVPVRIDTARSFYISGKA